VNINDFVKERKPDWDELERIAGRLRPSVLGGGLTGKDLWELGRLYLAAVSDLELLRASPLGTDPGNRVINYLNGLVIRVHGAIYRKPPVRWTSISRFFLSGFPSAVRDALPYVCVSAAVLVVFGVAGFVIGLTEPEFTELIVPENIIDGVERGQVWFKGLYAAAPQASSWLMTHNVSVTFLIVASGVSFGVGTVYLLALNGLLIGVISSLCFRHGLSLEFWSFVLPHGSLELPAVAIAGAAGLVIGHALIDPGPHRRGESLAIRGEVAAKLALGCVGLLVCAGITEAFLSPSGLPAWVKFVFAGASFACLLLLLAWPQYHTGK
jgi:uncharacterized membrane protein SpoIIM required for sporulation